MQNQLNERVILAVKRRIPEGSSLLLVLMKLLSLGKEAIYRRLRGDVPFTLEEAVKISQKFSISLDQLSGTGDSVGKFKWAAFDVDLLYSSDNYMEKHCEKLELFLPVFKEMQTSKKSMLREATSFMPYTFMLPFKKLAEFRHYRWVYLAQETNPNFHFSELVIPSSVLDLEKRIVAEVRLVPRTLLILDREIFSSILNDINYFVHRGLVTEQELLEMKEELYSLISFMENLTAKGFYDTGGEINIFLSEIKLDSAYSHFEYDNKELSLNWAYFVDVFNFQNPRMGQKQKEWIELLKRYSTQITQTGEMQRVDFFNKQKKLIDSIGQPI